MLNPFEEMNSMAIYEMNNFQILIFMFNCKNNPLIFQNLFTI